MLKLGDVSALSTAAARVVVYDATPGSTPDDLRIEVTVVALVAVLVYCATPVTDSAERAL